MGEGHGKGVIAAVIHDDIAFCAVLKVGESGQPLVLVGEQRESVVGYQEARYFG